MDQSNRTYDILIIGGGAVGCAVARELSRSQRSVALVEKEADVAAGTSGRNSAVVHAGFNNRPGSLMAQLCVEGNQGFAALCRQLEVPYRKTGKLLVAFDQEDLAVLRRLLAQGEANGCRGLHLLDQAQLGAFLPQVGGIGAMVSPETGIFDPFLYTVALAENAVANGVHFFFRHPVTAIAPGSQGGYVVTAGGETFSARVVVNAAGLFSDRIAALAGVEGYRIYPCRGEYFILDQIAGDLLPLPVYPAPKAGAGGLGVHLTPTIHGNLLIGPSAEYIQSPEDTASTRPVMDQLFLQARQLLPALEKGQIIGAYAGLRPKLAPPGEGGYRDFVIREDKPGFVNLVGIESPGLTASLPIARRVAALVGGSLDLSPRADFQAHRRGIRRFRDQSPAAQAALIAADPDYGEVVCRCQTVTRAELRQAVENPLGVRTLAGIKYRAWATTGRCQGGYCLPKIAQMLVEDYGLAPEDVTYRGEESPLFAGRVK
ncbi:MAG: NAD(P)/FAD-dependent oxidoreductase [Evtepia gabavorous]|uniref:NAD(P)/FAD-dependent oxidoreductase n=1 Tax=Evtepia gabavorous TaxID=2211183 RepID=UPI002E7A3013|nr:NAD(P)/FAD-dependent oxidoreductase [Evtepia gabavorous]MEE0067393.1 NAD(P)/FAD-dependent oxidoreductase [Evtepia gabavorous]